MAEVAQQLTPTPTSSWQRHKGNDSMDSEFSYFDTGSTSASDGWSSYFEGWEPKEQTGSFVTEIVRPTSSKWINENGPHKYSRSAEISLPPAPKPRRPEIKSTPPASRAPVHVSTKSRRYGLVSMGDPKIEDEAINKFNVLLQNSSASTEDILAAMYNPTWDVAALQRWYQASPKGPSDLALYKIMFSLRYSPEEGQSR